MNNSNTIKRIGIDSLADDPLSVESEALKIIRPTVGTVEIGVFP